MYFLNMLESDVPYTHLYKVMIKKIISFSGGRVWHQVKKNKIKKAISDKLLGENNDFNFEIPWNVSISQLCEAGLYFIC